MYDTFLALGGQTPPEWEADPPPVRQELLGSTVLVYPKVRCSSTLAVPRLQYHCSIIAVHGCSGLLFCSALGPRGSVQA